MVYCETQVNNKVCLRERKRHTVRRAVSSRYAALSPDSVRGGGGVTHPVLQRGGGYPELHPPSDVWGTLTSGPGMGYPHLDLGWGTPQSAGWGTPQSAGWGTPVSWMAIQTWDAVPPVSWMGYHPVKKDGVPPNPDLEWDTPPPRQLDWVPPVGNWDGVPPLES